MVEQKNSNKEDQYISDLNKNQDKPTSAMKMLEVTCDTLEIFFKKYYDRTHEIIEHLANKGHEKEQSEP